MCTIVYTFAIVTKRHAILIAKRALADPSEESIITTNPAPKITPTNFTQFCLSQKRSRSYAKTFKALKRKF